MTVERWAEAPLETRCCKNHQVVKNIQTLSHTKTLRCFLLFSVTLQFCGLSPKCMKYTADWILCCSLLHIGRSAWWMSRVWNGCFFTMLQFNKPWVTSLATSRFMIDHEMFCFLLLWRPTMAKHSETLLIAFHVIYNDYSKTNKRRAYFPVTAVVKFSCILSKNGHEMRLNGHLLELWGGFINCHVSNSSSMGSQEQAQTGTTKPPIVEGPLDIHFK